MFVINNQNPGYFGGLLKDTSDQNPTAWAASVGVSRGILFEVQ